MSNRIMAADFSAIEARVVAWLAGEQRILDAFHRNEDVYCVAASAIYGRPITKKDNPDERFIGKVATLALGYQGGVGAFATMAKGYGLDLEPAYEPVMASASEHNIEKAERAYEERGKGSGITAKRWIAAELIKLAWREANPAIVQLWYDLENAALAAVQEPGTQQPVGRLAYKVAGSFLWCKLPSGRLMCYPYPRLAEVETPWGATKLTVVYKSVDGVTKKWGEKKGYGGLFAENCLARGTQVLTDVGWRRIEKVDTGHKLWDGLRWVSHEGLLDKGLQPTGSLSGVRMTGDHLVLTEQGWVRASQSGGLERPTVRLPDSGRVRGVRWAQIAVACALRLRCRERGCGERTAEGTRSLLWLPPRQLYFKSATHARDVGTPGVSCLEGYDRSVRATFASSVRAVRSAGYFCLRALAGVRELLGGYGRIVPAGSYTGPRDERRGIQPGQLPVGGLARTSAKHPQQPRDRHAKGPFDALRGRRGQRHRRDDARVQGGARMACFSAFRPTGHYEQVFDLKNAGPLHRFTVRGVSGEVFLVHNCTQAIARDLMAEAMLRVDTAGYPVVLTVHDEAVCEVPKDHGDLDTFTDLMSQVPDWADGLPLAAEAWEGPRYRK